MLTGINYLLVTCLVTITTAIRVDWNTNTGPIVPPIPRTTVRPIPPFREPAPVWEDLSNDLPNPNPYIYVPPPPSRPKQSLNTNVNYNLNPNKYGTIITPQNVHPYYQQNSNNPQVASLSPQYIPGVGTRYVAVVPKAGFTTVTSKYPAAAANALSPADNDNGYKFQGKYNAKTKKYKAFEKVKYAPLNYYTLLEEYDSASEASSKRNVPDQIPVWVPVDEQELPHEEYSIKFDSPLKWHATTAASDASIPTSTIMSTSGTPSTSTKSLSASSSSSSPSSPNSASPTPFKFYSKYVYAKDSTPKPKEKSNKKS